MISSFLWINRGGFLLTLGEQASFDGLVSDTRAPSSFPTFSFALSYFFFSDSV